MKSWIPVGSLAAAAAAAAAAAVVSGYWRLPEAGSRRKLHLVARDSCFLSL